MGHGDNIVGRRKNVVFTSEVECHHLCTPFFQQDFKVWLVSNLKNEEVINRSEWGLIFAVALDLISQNRNKGIFEGNRRQPMEIIGHLWIQVDAIYVSNDYHSSLMLRPNCENNIVNVSWRHPPSDSFKLNCDASVQPQCKKAFIEGVFRNHFGNVIFAYSFDIGSCSVLIAETWAILIGIQTA
ncbi:hypothetical protein JHK87_012152 [Glycine soja]|nr:hypothetical protein JHK87_012152 [Glycine soja]